ncbi:MAG: hypothetical protein LVS60_09635 [Nodosilinea sp. LVE1205-7]|jgi:hypothetical protein
MQFEGLDQNAIKMAILTITDSAGISSSIVEEGEDWYVTLDLEFEYIPEDSQTLSLNVYLEAYGGGVSSETQWSGKQTLTPNQYRYALRVKIDGRSISKGLYRVSVLVEVKDIHQRKIIMGYDDAGVIQIYSNL